MTWAVVFSHKARNQLIALDEYIAAAASPDIADRYTGAIADFCFSLTTSPERGLRRDDIHPGARITNNMRQCSSTCPNRAYMTQLRTTGVGAKPTFASCAAAPQ